jgi:hypothetical protein
MPVHPYHPYMLFHYGSGRGAVLRYSVMLVVVLISVPGDAAERLVPYDDFNTTQINSDKWFEGEYSLAFPRASTEAVRQL